MHDTFVHLTRLPAFVPNPDDFFASGGMKDEKESYYSPFEGMAAKGAKGAKTSSDKAMKMSKFLSRASWNTSL